MSVSHGAVNFEDIFDMKAIFGNQFEISKK